MDGLEVGLPEVGHSEPVFGVDQGEEALARAHHLAGRSGQPHHHAVMGGADGGVLQMALSEVQRRAASLDLGLGRFVGIDGHHRGGVLLLSLDELCGGVTRLGFGLVELLPGDVALRRQRPETLHRAVRQRQIGRRLPRVVVRDEGVGVLRGHHPPSGAELRLRHREVGLGLGDGVFVGDGVDLKEEVALADPAVLDHPDLDDAATDGRRDVDGVGVDRCVIRGWAGAPHRKGVEAEAGRTQHQHQGDQPGDGNGSLDAFRLHGAHAL